MEDGCSSSRDAEACMFVPSSLHPTDTVVSEVDETMVEVSRSISFFIVFGPGTHHFIYLFNIFLLANILCLTLLFLYAWFLHYMFQTLHSQSLSFHTQLDILDSMPDVLGISQDALCPDSSYENIQHETGTTELCEHQLDLLVVSGKRLKYSLNIAVIPRYILKLKYFLPKVIQDMVNHPSK